MQAQGDPLRRVDPASRRTTHGIVRWSSANSYLQPVGQRLIEGEHIMTKELEALRLSAFGGISELMNAVVAEHWDSCDIADAIVEVAAACGFHTKGNLAGLMLGIPNDYSELIEGLHCPEEGDEEQV